MTWRWLGLPTPILLAIASAAVAAPPDLPAWLAGTWQRMDADSTVREHWEGPAGGLMVGLNLSLRGEHASFEFLRIATDDTGRLVYHASPGGRHPPTAFPLERADAGSLVFANAAHDFPRRIGYERQADGELVVWIEGPGREGDRRIEWRLRRVGPAP